MENYGYVFVVNGMGLSGCVVKEVNVIEYCMVVGDVVWGLWDEVY